MPPMVVWREDRILGVLSFEHARGVGDTNVERAIWRELFCRVDHRSSRVLLEDIPDHLDSPDVALPLAELNSFIQPPDCRTESYAPHSDETLVLHLAEGVPDRRVAHVLHFDVVQLQDIDVVRLEALEALVESEPHVVAIELLRQLALAAPRCLGGRIVDVVADLRRIDDIPALSTESLGELLLTSAVAVGVGGVKKVDTMLTVCGA